MIASAENREPVMVGKQFVAFLLGVLGTILSLEPATAQEWTRFRGPNGTGESEAKSIPAQWTNADYNWKVTVPGIGHSSPVLWGDHLFILSADPETAMRHTLCYDAFTGEKIWEKSYASQTHGLHKQSSYASGTPAVDEKHVYFAWASPASITLIAMTHDGHEVWKRDLGTWSSQHGFGTSPMVYEDMVLLFNSQEDKDNLVCMMMAFDCGSGKDRWKTPCNSVNASYSVPAVLEPKNGSPQLVCTNTGDGTFALDPADGHLLWSNPCFDKRTVSSPLVKGDMIFGSTGSGGGGNYLVATQFDGKEPKQLYRMSTQAPYVPTSVARDDMLFLMSDGGIATCLDLKSGKTHWQKRVGGNYSSSLVRAHDKIYCPSMDGEIVVLAAEKEFKELGRSSLGDGIRSTAAIANGQMYLHSYSHLMSIGGPRKTASASK
jgi:outer membrane protein assembly factor BamB